MINERNVLYHPKNLQSLLFFNKIVKWKHVVQNNTGEAASNQVWANVSDPGPSCTVSRTSPCVLMIRNFSAVKISESLAWQNPTGDFTRIFNQVESHI